MKSLLFRIAFGQNPRRTLLRALILAAVLLVTGKFAFTPCRIDGKSMEPTYQDRGVNVINRLQFRFREPERGDVVVIPAVEGRRTFYLKRVLGLPGETIAFDAGQLMVNEQPREEGYLENVGTWDIKPITLRDNEYFVAGDNRAIGWVFHVGGAVRGEQIAGGVLF